jgi:hypothetical protein
VVPGARAAIADTPPKAPPAEAAAKPAEAKAAS